MLFAIEIDYFKSVLIEHFEGNFNIEWRHPATSRIGSLDSTWFPLSATQRRSDGHIRFRPARSLAVARLSRSSRAEIKIVEIPRPRFLVVVKEARTRGRAKFRVTVGSFVRALRDTRKNEARNGGRGCCEREERISKRTRTGPFDSLCTKTSSASEGNPSDGLTLVRSIPRALTSRINKKRFVVCLDPSLYGLWVRAQAHIQSSYTFYILYIYIYKHNVYILFHRSPMNGPEERARWLLTWEWRSFAQENRQVFASTFSNGLTVYRRCDLIVKLHIL